MLRYGELLYGSSGDKEEAERILFENSAKPALDDETICLIMDTVSSCYKDGYVLNNDAGKLEQIIRAIIRRFGKLYPAAKTEYEISQALAAVRQQQAAAENQHRLAQLALEDASMLREEIRERFKKVVRLEDQLKAIGGNLSEAIVEFSGRGDDQIRQSSMSEAIGSSEGPLS